MRDSSPQPTPGELAAAVVAAVIWAIVGIGVFLSLGAAAHGAPCRVHNYLPNGTSNVGSGTLIDVKADGSRGLILSCAHLFAEGAGRVVVEFPDGRTHGAILAAVDHDADLAALEIAKPQAEVAPLSLDIKPAGALRACGFGPSGDYRCAGGPILGYSERPGQQSLRMAGSVRSGDSGGGVFDDQGRLVAVVWGESGGVTYASTGRPLAAFLDRVLDRRRDLVAAKPAAGGLPCPDGRCPLIGGGAVLGAPIPARPGSPVVNGGLNAGSSTCACSCDERLSAIAAQLERLNQSNQDRGDHAVRDELESEPHAPADGLPTTLGRAGRAAAALATTALGVSGPVGWGVIAAGSIGGWLLGRRVKRRSRAASHELREQGIDSPLATRNSPLATRPEATAAAEQSFPGDQARGETVERRSPIERDDREARELLRLSQLEGRDPLQDAVAGRLALDRLDALAESDADSQQATWADKLRRELRDRFNDIAPTKFQVNGERGMGCEWLCRKPFVVRES